MAGTRDTQSLQNSLSSGEADVWEDKLEYNIPPIIKHTQKVTDREGSPKMPKRARKELHGARDGVG